MRFSLGIFILLAGILSFPSPVTAQTGFPPPRSMPASLGSGNPLRVTHARETIRYNALAGSLYADLYRLAGSEPTSRIQHSAVAKALGFVLIIGLDAELDALSPSEISTKQARLTSILAGIDPDVSGVAEEFQWRAVELMQFVTAYDFLRAARGVDIPAVEHTLARFADNALGQLRNNFVVRNNLSLKLAAAVGYAGLVLRDTRVDDVASTPAQWFEEAFLHIEKTLFDYQGTTDGSSGYSEGPWYFRYAMQSVIPFLLAIDDHRDGDTIIIGERTLPSPLRDPRFHRLFEWIATLRMPDGMLPPFEDTYMQAWFPETASIAARVPELSWLAWRNYVGAGTHMDPSRLSSELARTFDARAEYLLSDAALVPTPTPLPAQRIMPDAGYAVFREGWAFDDLYVAFIGKHGIARTHRSPVGSGHKQANEGAFLLHAGGELLAIEPGYHSSDERGALIFGENHNILLIDGKGPDSTSWGTFLFGVDAMMTDTLTGADAGAVTIRTAYQGATIERRATVLGGRFVILADRATSACTRVVTHQVHGNGLERDAGYTADAATQSATWTRGHMRLHAMVAAAAGAPAQQTVTRPHAPAGGRFAEHSALYSVQHGTDVRFHTVMTATPSSETVTPRVLAQDGDVSLLSLRGGRLELLSLSNTSGASVSAELPTLGRLRTDARAVHCILDSAGRPKTWMLDEGSSIQSDDRMLLSSSHIVRAVVAFDEREIRLSVRGIQTPVLQLRVPRVVTAIHGAGVGEWELRGSVLHIVCTAPDADLRIELGTAPTGIDDGIIEPRVLTLHAPYPQPVDAGSPLTCTVALPAAGTLRLTIHDALGRELRAVHTATHEAGTHMLRLATTGLPSGLYLLRAASTDAVATRRLILR
ncbi:MAG: heparinase II/III family protein [Bacteroidota bacterium]|jgi:hypothetical protein|nr:heparinase II/III family protein [Bacteroidota bacterium]